jgi:hypothetical protein
MIAGKLGEEVQTETRDDGKRAIQGNMRRAKEGIK